ncbi:hypothetical protein WSM22_40290 [Cytophagales bacterium WSM2-2]|nr:hypothetical protein WSM22_40290 [Cytophagales bacterium WSM2-2]
MFKNSSMKKYTNAKIATAVLLVLACAVCCTKEYPIDEDGLLITTRISCYASNFDLLGTDFISVVTSTTAIPATSTTPAIPSTRNVVIDTVAQTINVQVALGTDLKNLYPQFTLVTDAKLSPKITGKVDFSDLANPKKWTVISGNRRVKKEYTVTVTVQQ